MKAHRFNAYRARKILFILSGDEADQADCIQRSFLSPAFNWLAKIAFLERLLVIVGVFALKQSKNEVIRKTLQNKMMIEVNFSHTGIHSKVVLCVFNCYVIKYI